MQDHLLSVIIPVFNGELYLDKLIDRILSNPYKNVELILGNDASTDGTSQILLKYPDHPQIKIFEVSANLGPGAMRNKLLLMAEGEYLAIQDADDDFDSSRFVKQVAYLNEHLDVGVVGSAARLVDHGKEWGTIRYKMKPSTIDWYLQRSLIHASITFRKSIVEIGSYNERLRIGEDYYFLTQLWIQGVQMVNLQEPLYTYNITHKDLKSRGKRYFKDLLKAVFTISQLFPFSQRLIFVAINTAKLVLLVLKRSISK